MLKKIFSWLLFFLLLTEGFYFKALLIRTDYGSHGTTLGCDVIIIVFVCCLAALLISISLFMITKPRSNVYLAFLIASAFMLVIFFIMNLIGIIIGIGDGIDGSLLNFICPSTGSLGQTLHLTPTTPLPIKS